MYTRFLQCNVARCAAGWVLLILFQTAYTQTPAPPPPANSLSSTSVSTPEHAPSWLPSAYRHALRSPLPALLHHSESPRIIPQLTVFPDQLGWLSSYQPGGPTRTADNAFFQPLGTNGRTCFTCHQTLNAMGMSAAHARAVFDETGGRDPLFAPIDGANCPNQVSAAETSGGLLGGRVGSGRLTDKRAAHSLLLNKGLFRIFLPVPTQTEYTIEVVSDPNGCNTDSAYNHEVDPKTGAVVQMISVYRRPLMSSNLKFKTTVLPDFPQSDVAPLDIRTGGTLPIDPSMTCYPSTTCYESLNIMWDGREPTLESQAIDATLIHAQAGTAPTSEQIQQIVAFENGIYAAQARLGPVDLWESGGNGGALYLSGQSPLEAELLTNPPNVDNFSAWNDVSATTPVTRLQASIARGQALFADPQLIPQEAEAGTGFFAPSCSSCHSQTGGGEEANAAGQFNIGVGGQSLQFNGPAPDPSLPIFKLTCKPQTPSGPGAPPPGSGTTTSGPGAPPSGSGGSSVVMTNDPGLALITGRCADIGSFTVPAIRGMAARAPYFHDGSAATIADVVNFYDTRFSIGLTAQQKEDLANFLSAL